MRPGLDAVTIDAHGTLVTLRDPVTSLGEALRRAGVDRDRGAIATAFAAEVAYYVPHAQEGRDERSLEQLRADCASVFLQAADAAALDPAAFAPAFVTALRFEALPEAVAACERLVAKGIRIAVVSNWDIGLHDQLARLGIGRLFSTVVTSAEAGAAKPDPAVFRLALERLGVPPARALHVGDARSDELGARAAGMAFRPAPLAAAVLGLT